MFAGYYGNTYNDFSNNENTYNTSWSLYIHCRSVLWDTTAILKMTLLIITILLGLNVGDIA